MKQKYFFNFLFLSLFSLTSFAQSAGDIAFIAFNADGDKDFAIVTLADIAASTTIYFTDDETTGAGSPSTLAGSEGTITWNTGSNIIKAGTVVVFTDLDSSANPNFGVSMGTITRSGSFNPGASKDGIIAFLGTDSSTPTTYIAAIQIGNDNTHLGPFDGDGITLTNTGLVIGTSIIVVDNSASPDGGYYSGSRSSETSYSDYYSEIETNGNWTTHGSDGESLLPFSQESFTINTTTWTGASSSVWNLAGNWNNGIPTSSSLVTIPNVATSPIISSGTAANVGNITIDASENLTINSGNSLNVGGNLTITGDLNLNNDSSLLINGASTGNATYNRTIATTNWYSVSSPVSGEIMTDMRANNSFANGSGGGRIGFAPYDNSQAIANNRWAYFNTASTDALINGKGYTVKLSAIGTLSFTGSLNTSDVAIALTQGGINGNNFNLLGNPFTAFVNSNTFLTNENANLTQQTIWIWNQATNSYDAKNLASNFKVAPGQGFFVEANNTNNVTFTESMQSHEAADTFQKSSSNSRPEIKVSIFDGSNTKNSDVFYIDGTTTGFDNGYDSSIFGGVDNSFAIYTGLVANSNGEKLAIQSLPPNDYENIIIPVGLNATSGKEVIFTINHQNLPNDLMVFIEDKENKTITRLDENNSNYKITLDIDSNGTGRFYLRTSTTDLRKTLDVNNFNFDQVNVYLSSERNLRISGLNSDKAVLTVFNILGKKVYNQNLNSSSSIDVNLSYTIKQGIYIVKIETNKGNITKKIFLK